MGHTQSRMQAEFCSKAMEAITGETPRNRPKAKAKAADAGAAATGAARRRQKAGDDAKPQETRVGSKC